MKKTQDETLVEKICFLVYTDKLFGQKIFEINTMFRKKKILNNQTLFMEVF